jgi:methanogenic corrinoid protein MtbC1
MRDCLAAIRQLDSLQLEQGLRQGLLSMGVQGLLQNLVGPLAHAVGDQWRLGQITAAHEHFASAAIRAFLGSAARPYPLTNSAPTMVVATPAGQIHELGAVIAAAAAANQGWRVTYLGVCLPAAEIAGAAVQDRARAVALSIVYPEDDPHLSAELISLRRFLPTEVSLVVGGRAAPAYQRALHEIGAVHATQLADFYGFLDGMRSLPRV